MAKYGEHSRLGSWDRLGGWGGPWLGPLAAGEGGGEPRGWLQGQSRREGPPPGPFRWLMGTLRSHFLGTLVWAEAPHGAQVTPMPHSHAQEHTCRYAVWMPG